MPNDVLIVELQVRSSATTGAADQEFVELYNTTDTPIDVSTWKLQYKSATGTSWTDKATLHGNLDARSHYLLVSSKYPNPPTASLGQPMLAIDTFNAGLSDIGGHVRIADLTITTLPVVHDVLGWGATANSAEGNKPAPAPAGGKSLKRHLNEDGNFKDTNSNVDDFELSDTPSPQADPLYVVPVNDPDPTPATTEPEQPAGANSNDLTPTDPIPVVNENPIVVPTVTLTSPQITELLPNPAAPASDSTDEFIELFNPNDQPFDLKDYKLQSGSTFSYSYTFETLTLAPHEYRAFLITQTHDILSNTAGQARLLDPAGVVVGQTNSYESAPDGQAWALVSGGWQWTTTPTPNEANVLTAEAPKTPGVVKAVKSTSLNKAADKPKVASTSKAAAKPKAAARVKPAKTSASPDRQVYKDPAEAAPTIHPGILVGVGLSTLLYAGYEYRYDAANIFRRLQRYRGLRRATRQSTSGQ